MSPYSSLLGQINQHKNQRSQPQHAASSSSYGGRHPRAGWSPYSTRGSQRRPAAHRNRTLILNNAPGSSRETSQTPAVSDTNETPASSNGWVAKRDRHMQLINSAIYDKEAQARTKAIAATQKGKQERRGKAEEAKVLRYAQGARNPHVDAAVVSSAPGGVPSFASYQIFIHDIPFQVARGGSKLIRQSSATLASCTSIGTGLRGLDDQKDADKTPKKVAVGGVTFVRSKNGNLHRLGAVVNKRYSFEALSTLVTTQLASRKPSKIKKKDELCKRFSRTGTDSPLGFFTRRYNIICLDM